MNAATAAIRQELDRFVDHYRLTAREEDVMTLLVSGCTTVPAIAVALNLRQHTVHNHFKNVFRRTRTNTKAGLLALFTREALARQAGLEPFVRHPRVLIAEPDPLERERLATDLGARGMLTRVEVDSTHVLERIAQERTDVVVADVALPGLGGRGVLDDVISRFGRHPIVLLTSARPAVSRSLWIARGALDLFEKPASSDKLAFAVVEHLVDSAYDRSRLLRVDADMPARINESLPARIFNVGFGGAFIALDGERGSDTTAPLATGSRIRIEFELPERGSMHVHGEVRWRRESSRPKSDPGLGVQFVEMREEQRVVVEDFVRTRKLRAMSTTPRDPRDLAVPRVWALQ
ncbi:MAG: PilZ domain-containing protein [Polyangiales bacterium]